MVELVCEICYYKGDKTEFEASNDYCKECLGDHAMCPKCEAPYHSATITDYKKNNRNYYSYLHKLIFE